MEEEGEPSAGWFIRSGTTLVGSRAMLDEGQPLAVTVSGHARGWDALGADDSPIRDGADTTLLPLYLDPMTKLFLVALMSVPAVAARSRPRPPRCPGHRRSPGRLLR